MPGQPVSPAPILQRPEHRGRRHARRRVAATTALALAGVLLATTPASASWVQTQTSAEGKVTRVRDGDTVDVDVWGDGTTAPQTIRNTGIQAMETGQCHAAEATRLMTSLAASKTVRLTARYASTTSWGRPVRYVDAESGSVFTDTQLPMLNAGHALALTLGNETSRWRTYMLAQQKAEATHQNLWDTDYCRSGPAQSTPIKVWVNYDGDGDESKNVNTEWVRILNEGTTPLSLTGWWLRSAAQDYFHFPQGTVVQPGAVITLYAGKGTATATSFFWGSPTPKFPNSDEPGGYGSGAYLFDPDGDLRSHTSFPCLVNCTDARAGKIKMAVNYDAPGDDQTNPNGEWGRPDQPRPGYLRPVVHDPVVARQRARASSWQLPARGRAHGDPHGPRNLHPAEPVLGQDVRAADQLRRLHAPAHPEHHPDRLLRLGHRPLLSRAARVVRASYPAGCSTVRGFTSMLRLPMLVQ